jgi:hypothetical protein
MTRLRVQSTVQPFITPEELCHSNSVPACTVMPFFIKKEKKNLGHNLPCLRRYRDAGRCFHHVLMNLNELRCFPFTLFSLSGGRLGLLLTMKASTGIVKEAAVKLLACLKCSRY